MNVSVFALTAVGFFSARFSTDAKLIVMGLASLAVLVILLLFSRSVNTQENQPKSSRSGISRDRE
ncbi:MAG TPA: hypothetical protein VLW06_02720 [Terriglobales bacterium]|nr:hypothetical protein [Terriglobales bacterium]